MVRNIPTALPGQIRTPCELHTSMRRQAIIIETVIPIGVCHQDFEKISMYDAFAIRATVDAPLRCANRIAIALGLLRAVPLMLTTFPTRSGYNQPAARLCIAPIELPTLAYSWRMPR